MADEHPGRGERIDDIRTRWSLLRLAHDDVATHSRAARDALVLRYAAAIRAYVGAMVVDMGDADELSQDIVIKLMQGGFSGADPDRGRFRDLLKVSSRNQVRTFLAKKQRRAGKDLDLDQLSDHEPADPTWDESWRGAVLANTWAALEHYQRSNRGSVAHVVMKLRVEHPEDDSPQLAERLSAATGKPFNAAAARQQLHRARSRFARLLLEEVARLIDDPTPTRVREELASLGLLERVGEFLTDDWEASGELRES